MPEIAKGMFIHSSSRSTAWLTSNRNETWLELLVVAVFGGSWSWLRFQIAKLYEHESIAERNRFAVTEKLPSGSGAYKYPDINAAVAEIAGRLFEKWIAQRSQNRSANFVFGLDKLAVIEGNWLQEVNLPQLACLHDNIRRLVVGLG